MRGDDGVAGSALTSAGGGAADDAGALVRRVSSPAEQAPERTTTAQMAMARRMARLAFIGTV